MDRIMKTVVTIAAAYAAVYGAGKFLHWSNKSIVTTEYTYGSQKLPRGFRGFRIVNVSDLQSQYFGSMQLDLLNAVGAAEPDLIVITGDLLDRNHTDKRAAIYALRGLIDMAPVYYINGNHELALPDDEMLRFYDTMKEMGVNLLMDDVVRVENNGEYINIAGLSEHVIFEDRIAQWEAGKGISGTVLKESMDMLINECEDIFTILLMHEPQYFQCCARKDVNLILSGHAHGGQFRLPNGQGLYSPGQGVLPQLTSGAHVIDETTMIISRGLGNSVFPFRLNNRPEIVVVTFE